MLAVLIVLSATLAAVPQQPRVEPPVSLERIREELKNPPGVDFNRPIEGPVATFRARVERRAWVPTVEEWIQKEFKLTALQRQSAEWGSKCCGINLLTLGSGLTKSITGARQRREVRRIREQIARELAELEARRKREKGARHRDRDMPQPHGPGGRQRSETVTRPKVALSVEPHADPPDASANMPALSEPARTILERMDPNRGYGASELRAFAPELTMDALREAMRELWIAREVERFRDRGWRRVSSTRRPSESYAGGGSAGDVASLKIGTVRPEDLFDHDPFAGWFK